LKTGRAVDCRGLGSVLGEFAAAFPICWLLFCGRAILVELKSSAGLASRPQKQVRAELLRAGATYWLARGSASALRALQLSGVVFRKPWTPPRLEPWEGPFSGADPAQRLPTAPEEAARVRTAMRRLRARRRAAREAALAAERCQDKNIDGAAAELHYTHGARSKRASEGSCDG
jgi:hypothetical protein